MPATSTFTLSPGVPYALALEDRSPAQALEHAIRHLARHGSDDMLVAPYDGTRPGELARQLAGLTLNAYEGVVVVPLLLDQPTQACALTMASRLAGELSGSEVRVVTVAAGPAPANLPAALALTGFTDLPGRALAPAACGASTKQVAA